MLRLLLRAVRCTVGTPLVFHEMGLLAFLRMAEASGYIMELALLSSTAYSVSSCAFFRSFLWGPLHVATAPCDAIPLPT